MIKVIEMIRRLSEKQILIIDYNYRKSDNNFDMLCN